MLCPLKFHDYLAKQHGIQVGDDVSWHVLADDDFDLVYGNSSFASYGRKLYGNDYTTHGWRDLLEGGKMRVTIRASVLQSDEAIVSVVNHEMYEVNHWRKRLSGGRRMSYNEWSGEVCPASPHNLHCEAWDNSNQLTDRVFGQPR